MHPANVANSMNSRNTNNLVEANIQLLYSTSTREQGLSDIKYTLDSSGFEPFIYNLESLFEGFKVCLADSDVDNLWQWYKVLTDSLHEIMKNDEVEAQFAKIIPNMIENLGSQKTVVRKSTHRCIASYVKLSLKLELVLKHIMNIGLTHNKHRTRQHSMLVIPALLSLKKSWVQKVNKTVIELIETVATKLFDSSEIVQKTAKKLLVELKRVYSDDVKTIIDKVKSKRLRNWCNKILDYDLESESEDELQQPVQKILQKHKSTPPKIKTNDDFSAQPIISREKDHEKVRQIKNHFSNDKKSHISETESTTVVSRPSQQPKVVYDNSTPEKNKPDIAATKTKPFKFKETPKKKTQRRAVEKSPVGYMSPKKENDISQEMPKATKESRKPISIKEKEKIIVSKELEKPKNKFNMKNFDESDGAKSLSNTQAIGRNQESMAKSNNQHIRKSMNNLQMHDSSSSKGSDNYKRSMSKQSTYSNARKNPIKPPLNNSSSQSSLSKMSNAVELDRDSTVGSKMSSFGLDKSKRHDTIQVEKQTSKPLMSHSRSRDDQQSPTLKKSVDNSLIKPNLLQSVHTSHEYSNNISQAEEEKHPRVEQNYNIEKESSSSSEDEEQPVEQEDDSDESEEEEFPVALNRLIFSFLPQEIAYSLNDQKDWKKRTTAIQKMEALIKKQLSHPNEDFPIYITDICKKMCKMMHDSNFKISLTSLRILHSIWLKYPGEVKSCLKDMIDSLSEKLSDNKIVIRHAVLKVFYALVTSLGANDIIKHVFPFLDNDNWHIREEILSILIMGCVTSNSTWGLSDPKLLSQICQLVNDKNKKVCNAAFEALWLILSKDASTAIILNSYLDPQVYNSISERCLLGILATVNYDGIVEFPTNQVSNSNSNMIYNSGSSRDMETESVQDNKDVRKHTQSVDQTYHSNLQTQNMNGLERGNKYASVADFDKTNSTTQSIGNKMWLPAFNMTSTTIQTKQSVRVTQKPYIQTPNQQISKEQSMHDSHQIYDKTNYTPEVHQTKPRTFANMNNPSMTTHSMNNPSASTNMMPTHLNKSSTNSNTFYSKEMMMKKASTLSDYNPAINHDFDRFSSEKKTNENMHSHHRPIKATDFSDMPSHSSLKTEILQSNPSDFEDNVSETRHRYSKQSNKSLESRNRGKNSFSQKKPPIKTRKNNTQIAAERPLSIDARSDDSMSEGRKMTPEGEWKTVLKDIQNKNNWEKQFKAWNSIKDFSSEHPKFFTPSDTYFSEIMSELSTLWNSLRTQLSRNALGTFAVVFENLGKKADCILENVIPMLLKKAADTNAFIAEEAEKALIKACEYWSESKLISAALSLAKTKVNGIKEKMLVALNTIIEKMQERIKTFKDKEKIISFLASSMNEASLEVRNAAKSGFLILKATLPDRDFEKLIMRSTSDRDYAKVLDFLEKESTQSEKFNITNGISTKGTFYYNKTRMSKMSKHTESNDYGDLESNTISNKTGMNKSNKGYTPIKTSTISSGYGKTASNFELIDSETMTKFNDIIKRFDDNDWKKRVAGLKSLSNFIQEEEKLIKKSKKFYQIIDVIVQCLKDNNSKVVAASQDIFSNIMSNISRLIEKGAAQIIEALSSNIISSNSLIKNWGQSLMKKLLLSDELECSVFIAPMWHQIQQGNSRGKSIILNIISDVIEIVYEIKPIAVTKHIFNLWSKMLDDSSVKGDTKKALHVLVSKWYELAGDSFVNSFPSRNTDKVWNILKSDAK